MIPYVVYRVLPPEIKSTPAAPEFARQELRRLGRLSSDERILLVVFAVVCFLWMTSAWTKVNVTVVTLTGIAARPKPLIIAHRIVGERIGRTQFTLLEAIVTVMHSATKSRERLLCARDGYDTVFTGRTDAAWGRVQGERHDRSRWICSDACSIRRGGDQRIAISRAQAEILFTCSFWASETSLSAFVSSVRLTLKMFCSSARKAAACSSARSA